MRCSKCGRHKQVTRAANSRTRNRRTICICAQCAKRLGVDFKRIDLFMDDDAFRRIKYARIGVEGAYDAPTN